MANLKKVEAIVKGMHEENDESFKDLIDENLKIESPIINYAEKKDNPSEMLIEVLSYYKRAFSNTTSEWKEAKELQDGLVEISWSAKGVHSKEPFMGVPASNKAIEYEGKTTYTFSSGKLIRYHADVDVEKMKKALSS